MTDDRYSRHVFLKEIGAEGQSRIAASRVFVIGAGGVEQVVELPLTKEEAATFHACCEGIRANMAHLNDL